MTTDVSMALSPMTAAGICLRERDGELQVLMVLSSNGRWIFPKGKVRENERPIRAAGRGTLEAGGWTARWVALDKALGIYETRHGPVAAFLLIACEKDKTGAAGRHPTWFSLDAARFFIETMHPPTAAAGMLAALTEAQRRFA